MTDSFERHRLTRWVKADVPTYGDEWGNEYEYDIEEEKEIECTVKSADSAGPASDSSMTPNAEGTIPKIPLEKLEHLVSNSTLVLSIDKSDFTSKMRDNEDTSDEEDDGKAASYSPEPAFSKKSDGEPNFTSFQRKKSPTLSLKEVIEITASHKNPYEDSDFLLLPPTYQTGHQLSPMSPETDASDRSYLSDTDSIQKEPEKLNVRDQRCPPAETSAFNSRMVDTPTKTKANLNALAASNAPEDLSSADISMGDSFFAEPIKQQRCLDELETLVLSIDKMALNDSDDFSFDDYRLPPNFVAGVPDNGTDKQDSQLSRAPDEGDEDDDWGYNSEHGSNFVGQEANPSVPEPQLLEPTYHQTPRHKMKTDALDSLIDDLSKMEEDALLFNHKSPRSHADSGDLEHRAKDENCFLPKRDSIHDTRLLEFENHSFNDGHNDSSFEAYNSGLQIPHPLYKDQENFVSSVCHDSVGNPPPVLLAQNQLSPREAEPDSPLDYTKSLRSSIPDTPELDLIAESPTSIRESALEKTAEILLPEIRSADFAPPPISKDLSNVGRRESTMSTITFNLGAWKPNTSIYRDQFVSENDAESQMNVSIYNKDDSAYRKFTRMGPVSNYAPSISNSSCVSVPDTVDTTLYQIDEDQLDEDYPDTVSVAKSYHPVMSLESPDYSLGSSVLHDHTYEKFKFKEESQTPSASTDDLPPIHEDGENKTKNPDSIDTANCTVTADLDASGMNPKRGKYPVSNWKSIMAVSQPVDRIQRLKQARIDEMNYDTGLSQWLRDALKSEESPHIQIGQLATQAYKNAQHSDIRRYTSIRSKVSSVRDKMETGELGSQVSSLGRKFLNRGKKLMKPGAD